MIWYWLIVAVRRFIWLFKIPSLQDVARISRFAPCPVCGNREGLLRCVWQLTKAAPAKNLPAEFKVYCRHECSQCGARWFDAPIVKVDTTKVMPSIARTELEAKEDRSSAQLQAPSN